MSRNFELPAGEDAVLRCSHFPAQGEARSVIVIAHGYKGFKDWGMFPYTAQALSGEHEVITFNFSHAGIGEDLQNFTELDKFARNTYQREIKDMEILLSYLSQHHRFGSLPLFLLGHSRGGATRSSTHWIIREKSPGSSPGTGSLTWICSQSSRRGKCGKRAGPTCSTAGPDSKCRWMPSL